jgi:hypothetical protein
MWPLVDLAPLSFRLGSEPSRAGHINKWLNQRSPGIRELTLRVSALHDDRQSRTQKLQGMRLLP